MKRLTLIILGLILTLQGMPQIGLGIMSTQRRTVTAPSYPACLNTNTVAWYELSDLSNLTYDGGTGKVSLWKDKLGSGHDISQATDSKRPVYGSGYIQFTAADQTILKASSFTWNQPEFIYIVAETLTGAGTVAMFDGNSGDVMSVYPNYNTTSTLVIYAGNILSETSDINSSFTIRRICFNGASSTIQINEQSVTTGNAGSSNAGGFTLGGTGTPAGWSTFKVKEIILRNVADNSTDQTSIYNYLKNKHGL